jgi:hypothetical protein
MITDAVTQAAPAVATPSESKVERNAEFLPTGKHYRMTGEMPAPEADTEEASAASTQDKEKKEKKTPPVNEDESATSNSDTAAASEAATAAEEAKEEEKKGKTAATSENRWQKITRENKELRDRLQRLETAPRDDKQTSQPAAETKTPPAAKTTAPKPKIDDVDSKTGKAKYANFAEYEDAKDSWLSDEAVRKFQETTAKSTRDSEQQEQGRKLVESYNKKFEALRAKYPDFDTVALNKDLVIPMGSVTDLFLQDSDHAGEVLYHLGQNPDLLAEFHDKRSPDEIKSGKYKNKITPQRQFRKLLEIESKFTGPSSSAAATSDKTSSAKPVTQAPRPPHQVSGKGTAAKDSVEQAVEDSDQDTYNREQNARDLARRKKGK